MAIWLIKRTDDVDYDETAGIVVRAGTEDRAMAIALSHESKFYGAKPDASNLTVRRVNANGREEVILRDFRAG